MSLAGLRWYDFYGIELPFSATAGPRDISGGLAAGFAHSPLGALLAAVNIGVRANAQWGPRIFAPVIRGQVTGPDAAALLADCQAAYDQASQSEGVTGGRPLGERGRGRGGVPLGRLHPGAAVIDLVSAGPGSQGTTVRAIDPDAGRLGRHGLEGRRPARRRLGELGRRTVLARAGTPSSPARGVAADAVSRAHRPRPAWSSARPSARPRAPPQPARSTGSPARSSPGSAWMVTQTVTWWVQVPSPDLAGEPAVGQLQQWILPLAVAVAVPGVIIAGGRMALTRKADPLMDVGSGLVVIAATSAVGVLLPSLLLRAGDAWSSWVLQASTGGQFASRLTSVLTLTGASPAVVVVLGIVAIIISAIQAVLMLFRQGALVVLAGMLPLAAAGMMTPATRTWFRRVTGWMLALIFYKPAAAAVYATAFTMIGAGQGHPHRPGGVRDGVPEPARAAGPDAAVHLDHRAGRRLGGRGRVPADRARRRRGDRRAARLGGRIGRFGCRRASPPGVGPARPAGRGAERRRSTGRRGPARGRARRARRRSFRWPRPPARAWARPAAAAGSSRRRRDRASGRRGQRPPQGHRGHPAAGRRVRQTAMSDYDTRGPRDYGGWRRRRGIGLFGLGAAGTLARARRPAGPDHHGDG